MSNSVITQEMINLQAAGVTDPNGLKFVLAENLNNPDGGFFTRLPGFVRRRAFRRPRRTLRIRH